MDATTAVISAVALVAVLALVINLLGFVRITEDEVGIVIKKFGPPLPPGRIIAINGEAGIQAGTLPPGFHFWYWSWKFRVIKQNMLVVKPGSLALIVARDGAPVPSQRILAKAVDCDNFQDAKKFIENGGEKGRQMAFLTAGTYRINTQLFEIDQTIGVTQIASDVVGVVTTYDGQPIENGEIAGPLVAAHDNFQNPQAFINAGGRRGLQEQVLLSGTWNLNPWFVKVEGAEFTTIPIGNVGVVISYVGKPMVDVSGVGFKHGNLVEQGHKGVWATPLYPGRHPLNPRTTKVEIVPTTNIVLNWACRTEAHKFDEKLNPITVRSKDGFSYNLDVSQIIHVAAPDAPKVISRVGSMKNLVDQVLEPTIGNYFRNSAQDFTVLDFLGKRTERQNSAAEHIRNALTIYDVQAIDTLIGDITPPEALMKTQTDRKIAQEQMATFQAQEDAQKQRQQLVREQSLADSQADMVKAERSVSISEFAAQQAVKVAEGEAKSMRLKAEAEGDSSKLRALGEAEAIQKVGEAKASAYSLGVKAMGENGYTLMEVVRLLGQFNVKLIPDTLISGGGEGQANNLLMTGLLSDMFRAKKAKEV